MRRSSVDVHAGKLEVYAEQKTENFLHLKIEAA